MRYDKRCFAQLSCILPFRYLISQPTSPTTSPVAQASSPAQLPKWLVADVLLGRWSYVQQDILICAANTMQMVTLPPMQQPPPLFQLLRVVFQSMHRPPQPRRLLRAAAAHRPLLMPTPLAMAPASLPSIRPLRSMSPLPSSRTLIASAPRKA
jgi:hypothetical protein